jgi:hypothetical protein
MIMSDADMDTYPNLWRWVEHELPALPKRKPKVWKAFTRHAGRETRYDHTFLKPGFPPTLAVDDYEFLYCKEDGEPELQKDGYYIQRFHIERLAVTIPNFDADLIVLARDVAEASGFGADRQHVVEATVLHELVHWCRMKAGEDVNDEGPPYAFERDAYGAVAERTWTPCFSEEYFKVK